MKKNTLIGILLIFINCMYSQQPVLHLNYNEASGVSSIKNAIDNKPFVISNTFGKPERIEGIYGNALRTDGFSTWVSGDFATPLQGQATIETWISLESYPSDEELPYNGLTPSAIVSQRKDGKGFSLSINTFGEWWFEANLSGQLYKVKAPANFPLYQWVHVAGVIDAGAGTLKLVLNGNVVASTAIPATAVFTKADTPLLVGKSEVNKTMGIFLINCINAAIDDTKIYARAKPNSELLSDYTAGIASAATTGEQAIAVPESRFENDLLRPVYHAMPPANWTNEPHGLVKYNNAYHMFYQRTPNGPFKTQMHWGHMTSSDLVHWENKKDALWPTLDIGGTTGTDMKGIWSGDVIVKDNVAHALYTSVNHGSMYNPGISLATSSDANLENWTKKGPVINRQFVNDFRDPYLWKDAATGNYNMIIGAAVGSGGGLDFYSSPDLVTWNHKDQFSTVNYGQMDIGSVIWEMPVFESLGNDKYLLITNPIGGSVNKYGPSKYTRAVYWIGTWNGDKFTPDFIQPKNLDIIHGHLSPTVTRKANGQLVGIGMVDERRSSQAQLNAGWCHTYSLPRVYSLLPDAKTLGQAPAPELQSLRLAGSKRSFTNLSVNGTHQLNADGSAIEIVASVNPSAAATQYGMNFAVSASGGEYTKLYYDVNTKQIVLDKSHSSLSSENEENTLIKGDYDEAAFGKPVKFQVFIDHSIIDVFINDAAAFSSRIYPTKADSKGIQLNSVGGVSIFTNVEVYNLDKAFGIAQTKINISSESVIAEHAENGKEFFVSVSNNTFKSTLNPSLWQVENLPQGVQVLSIARVSDTKAKIVLQGNSTSDYDTDRSVTLSVPASEFTEDKVPSMVTGTAVIFKAIQEAMTTLTLSSASELKEGFEAGKEIEVKVSNNKWATVLNSGSWTLQNLPSGLQYNISRIDSTRVKIILSGTAQDYDKDITNFTVTVALSEFLNSDPEITSTTVSVNQGIVFKAVKGELVYDFESGDLANWSVVSGNAFSNADVTNKTDWFAGTFMQQGTYHMWGFLDGEDVQVGEMRTGTFTLEGDGKINFLIAGGNDINNLYLALVNASTGAELMKATGDNSETYKAGSFDASAYKGLNCYLKAVDKSTGGWGHLNLDAISVPVPDNAVMPLPPSLAVTGVVMNPSSFSLAVGETRTITASISPENATNKNVTWSSLNTAVAEIDAQGKVTAKSTGTAVLKVQTVQGGFTAQSTLTVTQAPSYLNYDFESGNLSGWTATGDAFSDDDVSEDSVFWGTIPFNQQKRYHLWSFKSGGDAQTGSIRTADFKLGGDGKVSFLVGGGQNLNSLYIALVRASDNQVLFKETGKNSEAYTASFFDAAQYINEICYIKVVDNTTEGFGHINIDDVKIPIEPLSNIAVSGIRVSQTSSELNIGGTLQITAVVSPQAASNKAVVWSSSNSQAATVDTSGLIRAIAAGSATITATTVDGGFTAAVVITVKPNPQNSYLTYDFESGDLAGWTVSGNAFSNADVTSDLNWSWGGPFNQHGSYHLWSFKEGEDSQTGSIQTQNFRLGGDGKITCLVGGGFDINTLYLALVRASDGAVLMKATGDNNDSEAYVSKTLDAHDFIGNECYIKIVDNATGGWGHLNVDNIRIPVQSSSTAKSLGLGENNLESSVTKLMVYPNPSTDVFYINTDESITVSVNNMSGDIILQTHENRVDLTGYASGIYILNVNTSLENKTFKIMKK
ncbi:Ig-like domain-containing protein [Flavobacterium sp. DGU38]|uniref:beta-fructofuranosidase n=1 Tax=Flavobacterium calami TaxID=3139144 RepID=A0ABU9IIX4_9FLAO